VNLKDHSDASIRQMNDDVASVKLPHGLCVRLHKDDCSRSQQDFFLDVYPDSPWRLDFSSEGFDRSTSAVRRINCPSNPPQATLYDRRYFDGN